MPVATECNFSFLEWARVVSHDNQCGVVFVCLCKYDKEVNDFESFVCMFVTLCVVLNMTFRRTIARCSFVACCICGGQGFVCDFTLKWLTNLQH